MLLAAPIVSFLRLFGKRAPSKWLEEIRRLISDGNLEAASEQSVSLAQRFPCDPRACHLLGLIEWRRLNYRAAQDWTRRSLALDAKQPVVWANLAAILMDLGSFDESARALQRALALAPEDVVALEMFATLLRYEGSTLASLRILDQLLTLDRQSASAHLSRALTLIQAGQFDEGWREYEWRWTESLSGPDPLRDIPRWDGGDLGDRRMFLWCDALLGDAVQFVRFAKRLRQQFPSASMMLACALPLRELFTTSLPGIEVVDMQVLPKEVDCHCPLMGLPMRLERWKATGEEGVPYLRASPGKLVHWKKRIDDLALPSDRLRVGLVWSGNTYSRDPSLYSMGLRRNMDLNELKPLLALDPRVIFFSLQRGEAARHIASEPWCSRMIDWSGELSNLDDTAALLSQLDLVVSVDTAVAHLAGALGRPVWMLARYDTCWRWFKDRSDTPWYPSMRIFNQEQSGNWKEAVLKVVSALRKYRNPGEDAQTS